MNLVAASPTAAADDVSLARHECPYPGLRPYSEDEYDLFFGREEQIRQICTRLRERRFVAVLGGSGSGKSSLVRAGVIPGLRRYAVPGRSDTWVPIIFTPGDAPIRNLAKKLEKQLADPANDEDRQRRLSDIRQILINPDALEIFLETYQDDLQIRGQSLKGFGDQASLLIVVDQFEEIFRDQATGEEVDQLIELITEAYDSRGERIYIVLTMRTEFLDRCAGYLRLPDILNDVSYLTRRLNSKELEKVIVEPARRYFAEKWPDRGEIFDSDPWPFEPEVRKRLLDAVSETEKNPDHLPLLQHLLFWLWQAAFDRWTANQSEPFRIECADLKRVVSPREADGRTAPREKLPVGERTAEGSDVAAASLLSRCLEVQADDIYEEWPKDGQDQRIAKQLFLRLAEIDGRGVVTRRWTSRKAVADATGDHVDVGDVDVVLGNYSKPHPYLRDEGKRAEDKIDVSHESFIRNWPKFVGWLDAQRESRRVLDQIVEQYVEWSKRRKEASWVERAWARCFGRVDGRTRARAHAYDLDGVLSAWSGRREEQSEFRAAKAVSDRECGEAICFYRRSTTVVWLLRSSAAAVIAGVCVLGGYWYSGAERGRIAALEARAYSAYAVASSMTQIGDDPTDPTRDPARLKQTAAVANDFEELESRAPPWEGGDAGLKFEAARRLAFPALDVAANEIIRSAAWKVDRHKIKSLLEGAVPDRNPSSDCLRGLLGESESEDKLYRGQPLRQGDRDGPTPLVAVKWARAALSDGPSRQPSGGDNLPTASLVLGIEEAKACRRLLQTEIQLGPTSSLTVDPQFRLVVARVPDPAKPAGAEFKLKALPLIWTFFGEPSAYQAGAGNQVFIDTRADEAIRFGQPTPSRSVLCVGANDADPCYAIAPRLPFIEAPELQGRFLRADSQHHSTCELAHSGDEWWSVNCWHECENKGQAPFCIDQNKKTVKTTHDLPIVKANDDVEIVDFAWDRNYLAYVLRDKKPDEGKWKNLVGVLRIPKNGLDRLNNCSIEENCTPLYILKQPIKTVPINGPKVRRVLLDGDSNQDAAHIFIEAVDVSSAISGALTYYQIPLGIKEFHSNICDWLDMDAGPSINEKWLSPAYNLVAKLGLFSPQSDPCKPNRSHSP